MDYPLQVIGLYIGLNMLLNLFLACRVSFIRGNSNMLTGTDDDGPLYRASRAHIVNTEYTVIGLVGLTALHLLSASVIVLHIAGLTLTLGRVLNAIGVSRSSGVTQPRFIGTLLTWLSQFVAAAGCLYYALTL